MTWDEQRRRSAALDAVISYAAEHSDTESLFVELPGLIPIFRDRRGLVVALQDRWSRELRAHIDLDKPSPTKFAARAWRECATAHPVLRRLLDQLLLECGDAAQERLEQLAC